ncbi:hypothetical protein PG994_007839 [Apiospora phragmitis]|uniref:Uncharacterized protein n=1 Tax=Apiospora phragmitis TaxID=2905665 RepID=A0ABR1UUG4_9PEZI
MVKRSTPTHEPSSSPFDFPLDVLGQGKLPRRIFRVSDDQEKILSAPTSWEKTYSDNRKDWPMCPESQLPNVLLGEAAAVPTSPSGPRSYLVHEEDDDDSRPGTPISGWDSSPPPVTRLEPPEESDEQPFASQLPEAPVAMMQPASSPGDPKSRRDQSSLKQPFETQLPARSPLQVGPSISNVQKRPVFDNFPSSSPAADEELEIVQPAAYDRDMMPPPPHKAVELNPTPPSGQQVQVPSTFPEPPSSKSASELRKVKAAKKHRLLPLVDVKGLLMDDLPPTKPLITSGLRAPPPKARPQKYVPESSFSDETSSSIVPSTEHHKTLHTPSRDTNGRSPSKTLIRETQVSLGSKQSDKPSQSTKHKPTTSRSLPQIAQSPLSSSHDHPSSPLIRPLASTPQPAHKSLLPAPSSSVPVPGPNGDVSGPRPDDPVTQPVEQNGIRNQEHTYLKERLADVEKEMKQVKSTIAYYKAMAQFGNSSSAVHTAGGSRPAEIINPPPVPEEDAMVVDEVPQQREKVEKGAEQTLYDQYTNATPHIRTMRKKALATYQYDDFIRAWTEGFVPYVSEFGPEGSEEPFTAIEWYMETVDNASFQFRKGIVIRENLETVFEKHPKEAEEAWRHMRVAGPKRGPLPNSLPPAEPVLALPPTPAIGTAQLLEQALVQTEEDDETTNIANPIVPAERPQAQQQLRGSQSDPIDRTKTKARKPNSPAGSLRHSASEIFSRKRPAGDELVAASPKRTIGRALSGRQSEGSTPSATLPPLSGPWLGPTKYKDDEVKWQRSWNRFLAKKLRRKQESIANSSALPGGTPTSGQKE